MENRFPDTFDDISFRLSGIVETSAVSVRIKHGQLPKWFPPKT